MNARVASNGDGFAVAWYDGRGAIRVARLTRAGEIVDVDGIRVAGAAAGPLSIASDGRDYLMA